ncbi:hypothetical protein [Leucobacter tardus]|uniref:Uncharacterized protein n=1 Tax=Leucobacter tardus TaxID=501483 RepID=A0A939QCJ8_9MICO|nr:hypothetical protein [Leucobacter tardus]MBO2988638.1 hypothetical protein [Leucobacter tardus]
MPAIVAAATIHAAGRHHDAGSHGDARPLIPRRKQESAGTDDHVLHDTADVEERVQRRTGFEQSAGP